MRVQIVGILVGLEVKERFIAYTIDDGSDIIQANDWNSSPSEDWDIGMTIKICGRISILGDVRQLAADTIEHATVYDEIAHWRDTMIDMRAYTRERQLKLERIAKSKLTVSLPSREYTQPTISSSYQSRKRKHRFSWKTIPPGQMNSNTVKLAVMQELLEKNVHAFTDGMITQSPDLLDCAKCVIVATKLSTSPIKLLENIISEIYEEGFIMPLAHKGAWERIGMLNLGKSLCELLSGKEATLQSLADSLHQRPWYAKVHKLTMRNTLKQLEREGKVQRTRTKEADLWRASRTN